MRTWMTIAISFASLGFALAQNFGVLDERQILEQSNYVKTINQQLQATQARFAQALQALQENPILTGDERDTLFNLLLKESPTEQEREQTQQMLAVARQRAQELTALRQKAELNETEKTALERFTQMEREGRENLQVRAQQLQQQLEQQVQQQRDELNKRIREIVAQIAKEKKLTMVFSSEVVYYAENDITNEVIKRLDSQRQSRRR